MGEPILTLRGVSSGYGNRRVLQGVDLEVQQGGFVTLIGPNGHGKTTLLRTISGLVPTRGGEIRLAGQLISGLRANRVAAQGVVHVPQGDLLFPQMSVQENLLMGAFLVRERAEIAKRLDFIFTILPKLAERRSQVASTLSGGERRMVGIGRGLMAGGRVLMLDEPSLGLAPIIIDQIYEVITSLKKSGTTILLVEENPMRAADLSDQLYLIDNGTIAWSGKSEQLMQSGELLSTYFGS